MQVESLLLGILAGVALALVARYLWWRDFRGHLRSLPSLLDAALRGQPRLHRTPRTHPGLRAVSNQIEDLGHATALRLQQLSVDSAHLQTILGSISEGILAVDSRLRVTFCNASFARAIGATGRDLSGLSLLEAVRDTTVLDLLEAVVRTREAAKRRFTLAAAGGRSFEITVVPLTDRSTAGAVAILHDTTDFDHLERVRKDFVANVSHEIRTPLAAIRGYVETLLESALDDDPGSVRRFLGIIEANVQRLTNIAADLLVLARLESDSATPQLQKVALKKAIDSAVRAVEGTATDRGVRLHVGDVVPDLAVDSDPTNLDHILLNLLDNAIKFNKPGGEVHITASRSSQNQVQLTIMDTGVGIPSEEISRVFERFYRVDKARSRAVGGTGLGLSIVKHAVEQMGGSIAVTSQVGRGSTFVVHIPIPGPDFDH